MKTLIIAAIAVAISGAAYAKDLKGAVMTDTEMDKVTAGEIPAGAGGGISTAIYHSAAPQAGTAGTENGIGRRRARSTW